MGFIELVRKKNGFRLNKVGAGYMCNQYVYRLLKPSDLPFFLFELQASAGVRECGNYARLLLLCWYGNVCV